MRVHAKHLHRLAGHIEASERAWLIIRSDMKDYILKENEQPIFRWSILNTGNTIAQLTATQTVYELVPRAFVDELPQEPDYSLAITLNNLPLPPRDSIGYTANLIEPPKSSALEQLDQGTINTIRIGQLVLLAYGYITYLDAFGNKRESRFCERYVWPSEGIANAGFRPLTDAPAAYTKYT